ncbi:MAG: ABC transporter ATP-binding protein [Acidobacteria bacterium]|nr:ABC transporter ATP-binding protein [Acidobacteriota bacterium]
MALIQFEDVGKSFRTRKGDEFTAVRDFSLMLERGEFFCLLGPSGCGKTTVLAMLAGFEAPTAGRILLDGKTIDGPSRDRGVVFQGDDSLYTWLNAEENVEFGLRLRGVPRKERRATARRYLDLVGLTGQQDKYPPELSGGMKQRIQIARALANEPKMLLMDEPFGALDAQTRGIMQRELRQIWRATGSSVLFITHDIDEAISLGSRVGVMTAGPGGTLKEVIAIELEGERSRTDPAYIGYYARIQETIRHEVDRAIRQSAEAA